MPETGQEDADRGEGATDITDPLGVLLGPLMGKENYFSYSSQHPGPKTHAAAAGLQVSYVVPKIVICG